MFSITVSFGPAATAWRLLYKTEEKAKSALAAAQTVMNVAAENSIKSPESFFVLQDDFGQDAIIDVMSIHGVMFENLDQSKIGNIEFALHQAHVQAEGQQRAENDPTLRAASVRRGPSVISPMGNGRY